MKASRIEQQGISRSERLRKRVDLRRVFRSPIKVGCKGLKLLYARNNLGWCRVVLTTSKGFKGAVRRNRQKRIGREIYRKLKGRLRQEFDLIFILYPGDYFYSERKKQISLLLQKADLLEK